MIPLFLNQTFKAEYAWLNTTDNLIIYDPNTLLNEYAGGMWTSYNQ